MRFKDLRNLARIIIETRRYNILRLTSEGTAQEHWDETIGTLPAQIQPLCKQEKILELVESRINRSIRKRYGRHLEAIFNEPNPVLTAFRRNMDVPNKEWSERVNRLRFKFE